MKTINKEYIFPDLKSAKPETVDTDDLFSSSILIEDEPDDETELYDYRFAPHLLMNFKSESQDEHDFYEVNQPSTIFYYYSKANDTYDTLWGTGYEKKMETADTAERISLSMTLNKKEDLDPDFEIHDYRFVSYFLMTSAKDLDEYYNRSEVYNLDNLDESLNS